MQIAGGRYSVLWCAAAALAIAAFAGDLSRGVARAADPAPAAAAAPTGEKQPEHWGEVIFGGGIVNQIFMGSLGLLSLVMVAFVIERAFALRRSCIIPNGFAIELQELAARRETDASAYRGLCARWTGPMVEILNAAMVRAGRPVTEAEKAMEDAAAREMGAVKSRIRAINILANVGPLVGLLGTVVGMILCFRMASMGGMGDAKALAEGIYMALVTTVAGLLIAIPATLAVGWFNARADKFFREIDVRLMDLMPCFALMEQPASAPAPRPAPVVERREARTAPVDREYLAS